MAPDDVDDTATASGLDPREIRPERTVTTLPVRDPHRYEIIAEHARGGIGRVLRAKDREFGRDVALKELLAVTPTAELRFLREAIITSRLEHPNIVPVHEAGRWPDGRPYYAMKLVSGRPLRALVADAKTFADRVALLGHVVAVADAMAYAHARGVIHRDLKPANIIVGEYGETIVIDWGLAKYLGDPEGGEPAGSGGDSLPDLDLTHAGAVLGTPAYMAPEQAAGGAVDERSDVYALGAILRSVLGGAPPRAEPSPAAESSSPVETSTSPDAAVARSVEKHPLSTPAQRSTFELDVPADLRDIVLRAMHVDPAQRYESARAFGEDLRRWMTGQTVLAHVYAPRERVARWLAAHRRLVQGSLGVLAVLLVGTILFLAREAGLRKSEQSARVAAESARTVADVARRTAETERDRADRTSLALLEQQGRTELASGHPFRAAPLLAAAYRRTPGNRRVRWLLTDALRAVDSLDGVFEAIPTGPKVDPTERLTYTLSYSPDDAQLITGQSQSIGVWDARTNRLVRRVDLPSFPNQVEHRSDGKAWLLIASEGGESPTRIIDPTDGHTLAAVPVRRDVAFIDWAANGESLASIDAKGKVEVWSVPGQPRIRYSFATPGDPVFGAVALSTDGSRVAARGDGEVLIGDPGGRLRHLAAPGEDVQQVRFSADGGLVLATLGDHSLRWWDAVTGQPRGRLRQTAGWPTVAQFSEDGTIIATAERELVHLWDSSSTIPLATVDVQTREQTNAAAFSHHGWRLAVTTSGGRIRTWTFPRQRWAVPLVGLEGHVRARFLPDGRILTLDEPTAGGRLRLSNGSTSSAERSFPLDWRPQTAIDVSRDGTRAAIGLSDGRSEVVDLATGGPVVLMDTRGQVVNSLAFSRDGHRVVAAGDQGKIRVYSADDGRPGVVIEKGDTPFATVTFSADDTLLLSTAEIYQSRLWNSETGEEVAKLPDSRSSSAAFSADGLRFVTSGDGADQLPKIWDLPTRTVQVTLDSPGNPAVVTFSPDGTLVATVEGDGTVRLFDARTGDLLRSIEGPTSSDIDSAAGAPVRSIDFSPDGKRLVATGVGHALVWNIELDQRTPDQVDALLAAKSPWRLEGGQLVLRTTTAAATSTPAP